MLKQRCGIVVVTLMSTLMLSSAHAAPPQKSSTKMNAEFGVVFIQVDDRFVGVRAESVKSNETGGQRVDQVEYNVLGVPASHGICVVPNNSISGSISSQGETWLLSNFDSAALAASGQCVDKYGDDIIIARIEWNSDPRAISNGFTIFSSDSSQKTVLNNQDGSSITTALKGKITSVAAIASVKLNSASAGSVIGVVGGPQATLEGQASVDQVRDANRTITRTSGSP